jgi:hypothetical protein
VELGAGVSFKGRTIVSVLAFVSMVAVMGEPSFSPVCRAGGPVRSTWRGA